MGRRFASAMALAVMLVAPPAWAGTPTEQLRGFFASAAKILDNPATESTPEERLRAVLRAVGEIFDFTEAARLSLGPAWNARTAAEREEFVRLFADLLQRSFVLGIAGRIHLGDGVKVSYLDESVGGAGATVWTTIEGRRGLDLPFTYRMIERGPGWAVRDVVIDGVSVAANYRAQFARILQGGSYAELIQQIRARVSTPLDGGGEMPALALEHSALLPTPAVSVDDPRWPDRRGTPPWSAMTAPARAAPLPASPAVVPPIPPILGPEPAPDLHPETPPTARERPAPPDSSPPQARPVATREAGASDAAPPHATGKSYWVQVGAFKHPDSAQRLAGVLREERSAGPARWAVVVDRSSATPLTRVRLGPFADRADAATQLRALEARGYKPFVASERD